MNDGTLRCPHGNPAHEEPWSQDATYVVLVADNCVLCLGEPEEWAHSVPYRREGSGKPVVRLDVVEKALVEVPPALSHVYAAPVGLPDDRQARKERPLARGVLDYFPDALAEVAYCSWVGNEQHNPGEPLHWAKEKSTDEADALLRHLAERGTVDADGVRHSAKVAWRALALLQREIDAVKAGR